MDNNKIEELKRILLNNRTAELDKYDGREKLEDYYNAMLKKARELGKAKGLGDEMVRQFLEILRDENIAIASLGVETHGETYLKGYKDGIEDLIDNLKANELITNL